MKEVRILWADDEIDLLKPHIMFLKEKGYDVTAVNNGDSAIELARTNHFDIIFLDEQMPGVSGLDALAEIKSFKPDTPVILITKSEEENIMEAAIGSKISDYLIKPVNPNQILLSLKKNLQVKELVGQKTTSNYQVSFNKLGAEISGARTHEEWKDVYRKLVYWELELEKTGDNAMDEVLQMQRREANNSFSKFIKNNYLYWFTESAQEKPVLSPSLVRQKLLPLVKEQKQTCFIVIDNLRYDQWVAMRPLLQDHFNVKDDDLYFSILPTVTQYARNSLFAGLMPLAIESIYPNLWLNDEDEGTKNQYEEQLFLGQMKRLGVPTDKIFFEKVTAISAGKRLPDKMQQITTSKLSVIVYNFIDTLSHARTEMEVIKELASDERAYRSLTLSWFNHSPLFEVMKELAARGINVVLTTDHGSIKVTDPVKVIGDKEVTTNLRYKQGKMLNYNPRDVFEIRTPKQALLPASHLSSTYIFTLGTDFFAYPNNYNYYVKYYRDTFQHGGVSLEEMVIPVVTLEPKI